MATEVEDTKPAATPAVEAKPVEAKPTPDPAKASEGESKPSFVGFPMVKFHPIFGRKSAADPNEAATMFQPETDWKETAELADMARTETEALQVMAHNQRVKLDANTALQKGEEPAPATGENAVKGPVRNSVAAQESLNAGHLEPL